MVLFAGQASAYQNGYYWPNPYYRSAAFPPHYSGAPRSYYPGYYYPATPGRERVRVQRQTSVGDAGISSVQATAGVTEPGSGNKNTQTDSGLSTNKQAFITMLLPYIEKENRRLKNLRSEVISLIGKVDKAAGLTDSEQQRLRTLASKYRISGNPLTDRPAREELLRKIDIIPSSLALAQAVNESAWGKSRFALEANNLFGIWTYDQDKGLKPLRREKGKTHLVRIFDDYGDSVRYYMYTLNSHPAYSELRKIRQQLRDANRDIDGHKLAAGLEKYSAKGKGYIELIRGLIEQNRWVVLDSDNRRV